MLIFSMILQGLLVLYYTFSGVAKIVGAKYWVDIFKQIQIPQWFRVVTGFVQLIGAILLFIGYFIGGAVAWAGILLGVTMIMACLSHIRVKDSFGKTAPALMFVVLNIILVILNADHLQHPFL